jgi:DNA primase
MYKLSDSSGSVSDSETSRYYGNSSETVAGKKFYQDLIKRADSVPLTKLFKLYGLRLDEQNRKVICPFSSHKGGRENSPSFYFYPQTNSFWCFGCKTGVRCCDFVSNMDKISRVKAAYKILDIFKSDSDEDAVVIDRDNFSEKLEIMLNFSNGVRSFRQLNNDEKSRTFIEDICMVYDTINAKHNLNNEALRSVVDQLKESIKDYVPCPML